MSAKPFTSATMRVEETWIDYNGHMNMAFYNVLFDRGADQAFGELGIGAAYARERRLTIYTAEIHVCYLRELRLGDRVCVTLQMLGSDEKRLHAYQEIRHEEGWLAATCEALFLHVAMDGPKVVPFPPDRAARIAEFQDAHASLATPERAGRAIALRRRP